MIDFQLMTFEPTSSQFISGTYRTTTSAHVLGSPESRRGGINNEYNTLPHDVYCLGKLLETMCQLDTHCQTLLEPLYNTMTAVQPEARPQMEFVSDQFITRIAPYIKKKQ